MKDASGASQMDPTTQVTRLHGMSMLDAAQYPLEANVALCAAARARRRERPQPRQRRGRRGAQSVRHAAAGGGAGGARGRQRAQQPCSPRRRASSVRARPRRRAQIVRGADRAVRRRRPQERARRRLRRRQVKLDPATIDAVRVRRAATRRPTPCSPAWRRAARSRCSCAIVRSLERPSDRRRRAGRGGATLAWGPLMRKRISPLTAEMLPWWLRLFGALIGASVDAVAARARPASAASPTTRSSARAR